MTVREKTVIRCLGLIVCTVLFLFFTPETVYGANVYKHEMTKGVDIAGVNGVNTLKSANIGTLADNITVSCNGTEVSVEGDTFMAPLNNEVYNDVFRVRLVNQTSQNAEKTEVVLDAENQNGRYCFSGRVSMEAMPDGEYTLFIYRGADTRKFYRNCVINVESGQTSISEYENIIWNNDKAYNLMSKYDNCSTYLDARLPDLYLMLRRNIGAKGEMLNSQEMDYIKETADRITSGAANDYEKAFRILEYIDNTIYYDSANRANGTAITNPATLISITDSGQYAATNCVGYAAMFAALARAEGIPVRVLYGVHRMDSCWALSENLTEANHHWTEFYYDGRWIMADADVGAGKSKSADGKFSVKSDALSYTFFDATREQIAQNYVILGLYMKPVLKAPVLKITHTTAGNNKITWGKVSEASTYTIYRSSSKNGKYSKLKTVKTDYAIDTTASTGKKYYYKVIAEPSKTTRESSPSSNTVSGTDKLAAPHISAKGSATDISVTCKPVKNAKEYKIYRSKKKTGGYTYIGKVKAKSGKTVKFTDKKAKKGTKYYYKAVAVHSNKSANSAGSKYVSAKRFTFS